jgi:hypothetical protein
VPLNFWHAGMCPDGGGGAALESNHDYGLNGRRKFHLDFKVEIPKFNTGISMEDLCSLSGRGDS